MNEDEADARDNHNHVASRIHPDAIQQHPSSCFVRPWRVAVVRLVACRLLRLLTLACCWLTMVDAHQATQHFFFIYYWAICAQYAAKQKAVQKKYTNYSNSYNIYT